MNTLLKKKPRLLTDLEITEISLVGKGASPGAQVTLWKRDVSKEVADPSRMLGINLLRVLSDRVEGLKREKDIPRMQAWVQVLDTEEGQQLLGLITKGDQSILEGVEEQDTAELADFLEGSDGEAFLKALSKQIKKGLTVQEKIEVVEKILKKDFDSQIEGVEKLKLDLTKRAPAGDDRTPEKRLDDFLLDNPNVETAIRELPNVAKVEVQEKRDFGPTYAKISKKVDELMSKGTVSSRAKGFVKVMDSEPELLVQYYKEQL